MESTAEINGGIMALVQIAQKDQKPKVSPLEVASKSLGLVTDVAGIANKLTPGKPPASPTMTAQPYSPMQRYYLMGMPEIKKGLGNFPGLETASNTLL